jgi:peroxiredoxin
VATRTRNEFSPGLPVGAEAPLIQLPDQDGRIRRFGDLAGEAGLYLLFARSVVWCPFCKAQLLELAGSIDRVAGRGLGAAAVLREGVDILKPFHAAAELTFPLLSDVGSDLIRAFGLLDEEVSLEREIRGIPNPGVLVLDRHGRIASKHFHRDHRTRHYSKDVLMRTRR